MLEDGVLLEGDDLHELLPHRYPFLMVDRIRVVEAGRRVVGSKRVTADEWWCDPSNPAMRALPFSLVIEAMAQTSGALVRDVADDGGTAIGYFMGADRVRFRESAYPGDEVILEVVLRSWRRCICRTHAVASVEGRIVATANLTTIVRTMK
ncbi:MAG: 3-hydroxyacyl-ACP dehydratase FabZ family protein [Gemmatimonadaceae bacterium]